MVEISLSGSGEGLGGALPRGYSTTAYLPRSPGSRHREAWSQVQFSGPGGRGDAAGRCG
jgi:hypothetical protein